VRHGESTVLSTLNSVVQLKDPEPTLTLQGPPTPSSSDPAKHPDLKRYRRQAGAPGPKGAPADTIVEEVCSEYMY